MTGWAYTCFLMLGSLTTLSASQFVRVFEWYRIIRQPNLKQLSDWNFTEVSHSSVSVGCGNIQGVSEAHDTRHTHKHTRTHKIGVSSNHAFLDSKSILEGKKTNVTLQQTTKAQRGRKYLPLLFNFDAICWWVVEATTRPLYSRKCFGTNHVGRWWSPEPVWMNTGNLDSIGIRSPNRPASSPWRVAIPSSLSRPLYWKIKFKYVQR